MWFDFINLIRPFFCRLFTKENGLGGRVEGLKPNVPNQEDDPHNSPETRPALCAKIEDPKYVYFGPISYSSVMLQALFIIHFYYLNLYMAVIDAAITWIYYYFSCVVENRTHSFICLRRE